VKKYEDDEEFEPEAKRKKSPKKSHAKSSSVAETNGRKQGDTSEDDDDFVPRTVKVARKPDSGVIDRRVLSSDDEATVVVKEKGQNCWSEVYLEQEEKWICVDVRGGKIHCVKEIAVRTTF
jgi:hypothetical protein